MSMKQRKRNLNRCLSCKRLKIKCDGVRPSCEYCSATGRQCRYEDQEETAKETREKSEAMWLSHRMDQEMALVLGGLDSDPSSSSSLLSLNGADYDSDLEIISPSFNALCPKKDVQTQLKMALYQMSIKVLNEVSLTKSLRSFLWSEDLDLRLVVEQLGITGFEFKLLKVYNDLDEKYRKNNRSSTLVHTYVSQFWHKSPLVRNNIFCMAILYLWDQHKFETSGESSVLRRLLLENVFEYSMRTIRSTNDVVKQIMQNNAKVSDNFQAAEIIVTAVMMFTFLALQPFNILPLIAFEPGAISLLSLTRALGVIMEDCFQAVFQSKYRNLLFLCDIMGAPQLNGMYPVVKILNDALQVEKDILDVDKIYVYKNTLDQLNIGIYRAIEESQPNSIYRWVFIMKDEVVQYMYNKEFYALKILFYFCCLLLMSGLRISNKSSMLVDYCVWFKQYNEETFGGWVDVHDKAFYDLVVERGFLTNCASFGFLNDFDPLTFEVINALEI